MSSGKKDHEHRIPTQKDIAKALGISRGTVDRALHNRRGVNEAIKKRIIQKSRELGYAPNRSAQFLVTGKTLRVAFITPDDPLWNEVREGADSFLTVLGNHIVKISWHSTVGHDPRREIKIMEDLLNGGVNAIGIVPADPGKLAGLIDRAVKKNIAVVTLNSDAPRSRRLCFVGQDLNLAGRVAGELMGKFLMGRGRIVIITAFKNVLVHNYRLSSFRKIIAQQYPGIVIEEVFENHDSEEEAYGQIRNYLLKNGNIDGIYLTTGNGPAGAVRALTEAGIDGETRVVCFDFFPETVKLLKSGRIHASLGQDPFSQGYRTVKILYDYVIDRKLPPGKIVHTRLDIGLRENIDALTREGLRIPN